MGNRIITVLALAFALTCGNVAAATAAPRDGSSCEASHTCFYGNADNTGTEYSVFNPDNRNTWTGIPMDTRGSVTENGGSDLWLLDKAAGLMTCVPADSQATFPTDELQPGYYYVDYGVQQDCRESQPQPPS
jgi:hypothetical protein